MTSHRMQRPDLNSRFSLRRRRRHWRTTLLVMVVVALLQFAGPHPTAAAHDQLVSSDPVADSVVTAPLSEIRLTFSEPITPGFAAVTLSVDDGPARAIDLRIDGAVLIAIPPENALPAAPQLWTLAYRIVSGDGHPIVDQLQFLVTPADAPGSRPSSQSTYHSTGSPAQLPAAGPPAPGPDRRWLVALAAALLVVGVATTVRARRQTTHRGNRGQ